MDTVLTVQRQRLTRRDRVLGVVFGVWMIAGLFLDGWAHDNNKPETFFTPWHGLLYSGFVAAGGTALAVALRHRRPGVPLRETLPMGHGLTMVGLVVFAASAVGDLIWHELLGVEVGIEALLSPTHLGLLAGGLIALSAPVRDAWRDSSAEPASLREFLPTVLCLALLAALVGFFLMWLSPFVNDAAGQAFARLPDATHTHPTSDLAESNQLLGLASILMTTVVLSVPMQLTLRRWRPPMGAFRVLLGFVVFLFLGLGEFSELPVLGGALLAGWVADHVARRRRDWLVSAAAMAVLWASYFAAYQLFMGGVRWAPELWSGAIVLSALLAAGIGLLAAPPLWTTSAEDAPTP